MKVSLSMWSVHRYWYEGQWDTVRFIEFAASAGAQGVELLSCFWRDKEKEIPLIEQALQAHGLPVACFCACNNFVTEDAQARRDQVKEVTDAVDAAVRFGAKVVRVFSGDSNGRLSYETALQHIVDGLKASARYAEENGVVLCLENHGLFAGLSGQVLDVIRRVGSDALRSTFDTGNFLLVGQDPREALEELKPYVRHVHVKDFEKLPPGETSRGYAALTGERYVGRIVGEGEIDLAHLLGELHRSGYDGWLSVEFEGEEEQTLGSERSVRYTAELVGKLAQQNVG
jgi:sugar phosphate isomerase/epimerase